MRKKINCILLVEDDEGTNFYNKLIIKRLEIAEHVEVAWNGREALDFLTNQGKYQHTGKDFPQPELIFLDINMPNMDGWDFLEEYQKLDNSQKATIIIIMLTTSLNPDDKLKAESISAISDFKSKPLTEEMLNEIMGKYFNN